jgi:hypothetical protein
VPAPAPDPAPWTTARAAADGAGSLLVVPWPDLGLVDGVDPRSLYAETFWLPVLGPSTLLLQRRLVAGLERQPDGYPLEPAEVSLALGLGPSESRSAPFGKAMLRLVRFHQAEARPDGTLAVRTQLPRLNLRQQERLPPRLQAEHRALVERLARRRADAA